MRTERWDYWEHLPAVVDWPTGRGARTQTVSAALTRPGTTVILHSVMSSTPDNTSAPLTILHGDGTTAYFTVFDWQNPGNLNGAPSILDWTFYDGLSIGGGTATAGHAWVISYFVSR